MEGEIDGSNRDSRSSVSKMIKNVNCEGGGTKKKFKAFEGTKSEHKNCDYRLSISYR